jgi:hypothetical protein
MLLRRRAARVRLREAKLTDDREAVAGRVSGAQRGMQLVEFSPLFSSGYCRRVPTLV